MRNTPSLLPSPHSPATLSAASNTIYSSYEADESVLALMASASATAMVEDPNFQDDQLANLTTEDIARASRILDNEIRILKVSFPYFFAFIFRFISVPSSKMAEFPF